MNNTWKAVNTAGTWGTGLGNGLLLGGAIGFVAGVLALLGSGDGGVATLVAVGAALLGVVGTTIYVVYNGKQAREAKNKRLAMQWIEAGRTPEEIARRRSIWNSGGWAAVVLAGGGMAGMAAAEGGMAGLGDGPAVNIDGTPMFGGVDANGNPFGVTYNAAADSFTPTSDSYEPPMHVD